jgi:hypothetical protein
MSLAYKFTFSLAKKRLLAGQQAACRPILPPQISYLPFFFSPAGQFCGVGERPA